MEHLGISHKTIFSFHIYKTIAVLFLHSNYLSYIQNCSLLNEIGEEINLFLSCPSNLKTSYPVFKLYLELL